MVVLLLVLGMLLSVFDVVVELGHQLCPRVPAVPARRPAAAPHPAALPHLLRLCPAVLDELSLLPPYLPALLGRLRVPPLGAPARPRPRRGRRGGAAADDARAPLLLLGDDDDGLLSARAGAASASSPRCRCPSPSCKQVAASPPPLIPVAAATGRP